MNIIIVGAGKVGRALALQLVSEEHDIVIIDNNTRKLQSEADKIDVQVLKGNGATAQVLYDAGIENCDIFISAASTDEINILCCLMARNLGAKHTIARIRNPEYVDQISYMREELGLSMLINPEKIAADEISRILRAPSALKIDVFSRGRVEIMNYLVEENSVFDGVRIADISQKLKSKILVCVIEREDEIVIPNGNDVMHANDKISIIIPMEEHTSFFKNDEFDAPATKNILIVGGGKISIYLAKLLIEQRIKVKIIEQDIDICEVLAETLPDAIIVHGDGTDHELLLEQGVDRVNAVVALTNVDEENIILGMFADAASESRTKTIVKVNRTELAKLAKSIHKKGSTVSLGNLTTQSIIKYVRSVQNTMGSNVENLYHLAEDKVEALEFYVDEHISGILDIPLHQLKLKPNILIATIIRDKKIIIARGDSTIKANDNVILITTITGLTDLSDILQ
ncbi:MAG: Trk system potassium transporter TrkA [Lachnospirales bacterium]